MALRNIGGRRPTIGDDVYVDESALLIGDVVLRGRASVWPCALLRADDDTVEVGEGSAVMDMAFLEAPKGRPVKIGRDCLVSHGARLHGCVVEDGVLIGIGAIVLDRAVIGKGSIVAAGSVVPPGREIPPGSVAAGAPAVVTRQTSSADADLVAAELDAIRTKARGYSEGLNVR
ncbi:MAG TPA: gamma carbonic anhydrase family protein [Thermoplasmata archaeon]|nr:gamma carbonic anhydrase family protein [Thermoplasmata archaeon]